LLLSGGLGPYVHESRALGELAGGPTSVLSGTPMGVARNFLLVMIGLLLGLNAALLVPVAARRWRPIRATRDAYWLLALWTVPAVIVYLLGHTGQAGYMLFLLPAVLLGLMLVVGAAWEAGQHFGLSLTP